MQRHVRQREKDEPEREGAAPPVAAPQATLLELQRTAGNAAVARLIERWSAPASVAAGPLIQRQPTMRTVTTGRLIQRQPAPATVPALAAPAAAPAEEPATLGALADHAEAAIAELQTAAAEVTRLRKDKNAKRAERKAAAKAYEAATKAHQAATVKLAGWTREHLPSKWLIDGYLDRTDIVASEKVATLGTLAASTARMEFLLGTMYHQGVKAKWEKDNTGAFPDVYEKAVGGGSQPWCTKFAGYAYSRLGFHADDGSTDTSMFHSGYRLRHWGKTGKNVDNLKTLTKADETLEAVASSGALIDSAAWKVLVKSLKNAKTAEDRTAATAAFFAERPKPQAGDIIVKPRGEGQGDNWFTGGGSSHTMLVDRFDDTRWTISTVEGNVGDKVGARHVDLTDPKHVGDIIFMARHGMEYFGDPTTKEEPPELPGVLGEIETGIKHAVLSEEMLLSGPRDAISRIVAIDAAQGWIKSADVDASVRTWITGEADPSAPAGPVKED